MEKLKELAFFEDLLNVPKNALVEKAMQDGRIPLGYNCYVVPEPLLSVGKAFPVRLRAPQVTNTELATYYMSPYLCSYSRSILESALDGQFDFLGGMTFASSCVHINRVGHNFKILNLDKGKENFVYHVFDFPVKVSPGSVEGAISSLKVLADKISSSYGIDMSDEAVNKAIHEYNEVNKILKEIGDLRKADKPKITGTEWHTVSVASKVAPKDMLLEPLKKLKKALDKREGISADLPRVMVMGSIFDNPQFTELIEGQGCLVVADRHCFGSLPGLEPIPETGDPYRNLAVHYLETVECPRMMGKENDRVAHVMQWVEEYQVDGIIMEVMKFCDLWAYEAVYDQRAFMEREVPIVKIEREYNLTGEGQMRTRVQAFIESIGNKRITEKLVK